MINRVAYYVGKYSAVAILIVGAVGMNFMYIADPASIKSATFQLMERFVGLSVLLFFASAVILWRYAYRRIRGEWAQSSQELRFARFIFLTIGFGFVGFYFYHVNEVGKRSHSATP